MGRYNDEFCVDQHVSLASHKFINIRTLESVTQEEAFGPDGSAAPREFEEQMRKWKLREQAARRRTGYRQFEQARAEALQRFREAQDALAETIPLTWEGLAAKACAFRKTYSQSEHWLMLPLMRDIAVLSGEIDRGRALHLSEEELANV